MSFFSGNNEEDLLQSADLAILLTSTNADGGIGGEVDGVDPTRNPGMNCIKIGLPGKLIPSKRKGLLEVLFS